MEEAIVALLKYWAGLWLGGIKANLVMRSRLEPGCSHIQLRNIAWASVPGTPQPCLGRLMVICQGRLRSARHRSWTRDVIPRRVNILSFLLERQLFYRGLSERNNILMLMKANTGPADSWPYRCSVAHRTTNYGLGQNKIYRRFSMSKVNKPSLPY
jgi:hypothetical protein